MRLKWPSGVPRRAVGPLALLLFSIATTAGVATQAYQKARGQHAVVDRVLKDYAELAVWSYEQHLEEALRNAAREILGPIDHGAGVHEAPQFPHASDLGHFIAWDESCYCHVPRHGPIPDALLAWTLGSDTVGVGLNRRPGDDGWLVDTPGPTPIAARQPAALFAHRFGWINDTVTARVRARTGSETGSPYLIVVRDDAARMVVYRLMPTAWGDTIVYAVDYGSKALPQLLDAVMDNKNLLPPTLTQRFKSRDVLRLDVETAQGVHVFRSDSAYDGTRFDATVDLPPDYGRLRVHAHIRPALAGTLVIGGTPRSQLPLLLGLLALATTLALIAAGQLVREGRLARDRTDFVASVSHELRTPLANVRLFLETLRLGRADTEEAREWSLAQMDRETRRLVHLVDNVLVFSRGPGRLLDEPRGTLDLGQEVTSVVSEYAPLAASRRAVIETDVDAAVSAFVPRSALRHVLLNLLDNAVKYGPAGQTVRVQVRAETDAAIIEVRDQGPGVTPAERGRIWEPFFRGQSAAARAVGGSGIGLHLVRELTIGMKGTACVADAPGGGAVFTIRLPRVTPNQTQG